MESKPFTYVYILETVAEPRSHYTGVTKDLDARLKAHNTGRVIHTAKNRPWRFKNVFAFRDAAKAITFEKYLKSHAGRAWAAKHL